MDPLYIVQIVLYMFLANSGFFYLKVIARYLIMNAVTSFLILKCWNVAVKIFFFIYRVFRLKMADRGRNM
jgi:hypothetical protein